MPLPLKAGYNFNYSRIYRPACFEMPAAEVYTDFYGISYLINGDLLSYSPEGTTILRAGYISFTPKNIYFRTSYISDKPREGILVKFTDAMVSDLVKAMGVNDFNELLVGFRQDFPLKKSTQEKVLAIFDEMEEEWNHYNEYSEIILKGLLHKLILICIEERPLPGKEENSSQRQKQDCLIKAIEYVKSHLSESPSLQDTANHINFSASYLSKVFINQLQTPYSSFILNEKILFAEKLLVNTKKSMSEIATETGFSSSAYMSDCFKRRIGMSPLQFRKTYQ